MQRTALHQHRGNRTPAALELGFNDRAFGELVRIGLQFEYFGLKQNHFEQLVKTGLLFGRHLNHDGISAPGFRNQAMLGEGVTDAVRIGAGLVNFVHGDDKRDAGGLGVMNRLDRLRHHTVVRGNDQDDDIGDLRASCAHRSERLMVTRCRTPRDLDVNFGLGKCGQAESLGNVVLPLFKSIRLAQTQGFGAAVEAREVRLQLERSASICADDFVHAIAELKAAILDRYQRLSQRQKASVDKRRLGHDQGFLSAETVR